MADIKENDAYEEELLDYEEEDEKAPDSLATKANGDAVKKFKEHFIASLPSSRRSSADFTRPVFTVVAFYLCAKRHKACAKKLFDR